MSEAISPVERIRRIMAKDVGADPVFASYSLPVLRHGEQKAGQRQRRDHPRTELRRAVLNDEAFERHLRHSALVHLADFLRKSRLNPPEPSEKKLARIEKKQAVLRKKGKFMRRKRQQQAKFLQG